jgi:hypothetical protein
MTRARRRVPGGEVVPVVLVIGLVGVLVLAVLRSGFESFIGAAGIVKEHKKRKRAAGVRRPVLTLSGIEVFALQACA